MRATILLLGLFLSTSAPVVADAVEEATITYLTSSSAYVDAGSERGVRKGSTLTVVRDGTAVTTLQVTALSSRRASCTRPADIELVVGDRVTFVPASTLPTPTSTNSWVATSPARLHSDRKLRGRVGVRYLGFQDRSDLGGSYAQPGLDVRVEGTSLAGRFDVSADVRTRRTWRTAADGSDREDGRTRVYALLGRWRPPGHGLAVTAGRQIAASLASVSIFDGIAASWTGGPWAAGAFGGTQPHLETFGWSDRIREYGAWFGWSGAARRTGTGGTVGFVGSWDDGSLDREYIVLQGRLRRGTFFGRLTQEVDLNRGWKRESESFLSPTSTFLTARWDVRKDVSLDAGFDTRRAVRLHRHRITPETEFDDSYRRGTWGGIRVRPLRHTSLGVSFRRSAGGDAGGANAVTGTIRTGWPALHGATVALRSTRYSNPRLDGWLHSLTVGAPVGPRLHAGLTLGVRNENDRNLSDGGNDLRWAGLDLDLRLSHGWYALVSAERSNGDVERNARIHASVVLRF